MTTPVTGFTEMFPPTITAPSQSIPAQGAQDFSSGFLKALLGNLILAEENSNPNTELDTEANLPEGKPVSAFQLSLPGFQAPEPTEPEMEDSSKGPEADPLTAIMVSSGDNAPVLPLAPPLDWQSSFDKAGISSEDLTESADDAGMAQPSVLSMPWEAPVDSAKFGSGRNHFPPVVDRAKPLKGGSNDVAVTGAEAVENGHARFAAQASVPEDPKPSATLSQQDSDVQSAVVDFTELLDQIPKPEDLAPKRAATVQRGDSFSFSNIPKPDAGAEAAEQPDSTVKLIVSIDRQAKEVPVVPLSRAASAGARKDAQLEAVGETPQQPDSTVRPMVSIGRQEKEVAMEPLSRAASAMASKDAQLEPVAEAPQQPDSTVRPMVGTGRQEKEVPLEPLSRAASAIASKGAQPEAVTEAPQQPDSTVRPLVSIGRQENEVPVEALSRAASAGARREAEADVDAVARALGNPASVSGGKDLPAQKASPAVNSKQQDFLFQLADRIQVQVQNGGSEIRIQLRPESLGRLEITAETGAQGVVARIVTESAGVKQFLESNLPVLQQSLQDNGLKVDRIDFILQDGLDARLFNGGQQQQTGAGQHASEPGHYSGRTNHRDEITIEPAPLAAVGPNSTFHTVA